MTASTLQLQHMPNNSDRVSEDFCRSERKICATPGCLLTEIFWQQNQLLDFDNSRNTVRLRTGENLLWKRLTDSLKFEKKITPTIPQGTFRYPCCAPQKIKNMSAYSLYLPQKLLRKHL